ncbi:hypothetical protein [Candidatus Binatus sp.]|jgi:hypothetical protein|uniref:hypothetical protein n=1 Tax=Candidatus Binatus sp. TaxID=2811406 RepID=UPI003BDF67C8
MRRGVVAGLMNPADDEPRRRAKEVTSQNAMVSDAQEGIGAFLEKHKRVWCGE